MEARKFETKIKRIRYGVYKEIINKAFADDLADAYISIPKAIIPGPKASLRCCIYKERAIVQERIKLAMGGDRSNPNTIEVIDIACDECPIQGIYVLQTCRGCISHDCKHACPQGAISIVDKKSVIDHDKCIECGKCIKACQYGAIILQRRPCVFACKSGAISIDENKKAVIDNGKCIECGVCLTRCPFGAISNKSMLLDVVSIMKNKGADKVYAIYAPAIESKQFDCSTGQIVAGIKLLGFDCVTEVAFGADTTLKKEVSEFDEKGLLISSCCPSFVKYVKNNFPELAKYISSTVSPMIETARAIKAKEPDSKVIFIGPCTGKMNESKESGCVDAVLSFEELQAFFDARGIDIQELAADDCGTATDEGKAFAAAGGLTAGISKYATLPVEAVSMSSIDEIKKELTKLKYNKSTKNFFEGMACEGGCINGALNLWHKA